MNKLFVTIGIVVVAVTCQADIKYWDNPEYKTFDVDCYVKIGDNDLIWNYDGIRRRDGRPRPERPHLGEPWLVRLGERYRPAKKQLRLDCSDQCRTFQRNLRQMDG